MRGKSGPGRPDRACTMGAIVSRICEIFAASSGFLEDKGIFESCLRATLDNDLFCLLIPLDSLMRRLGITSYWCQLLILYAPFSEKVNFLLVLSKFVAGENVSSTTGRRRKL
jgi:hypothetical protein